MPNPTRGRDYTWDFTSSTDAAARLAQTLRERYPVTSNPTSIRVTPLNDAGDPDLERCVPISCEPVVTWDLMPVEDEFPDDMFQDDIVRYDAPSRNLRAGDRVRFTTVNGIAGTGVIRAPADPVVPGNARNVPDWVPNTCPHQCFTIDEDNGGSRSSVAWFRINRRMETDE